MAAMRRRRVACGFFDAQVKDWQLDECRTVRMPVMSSNVAGYFLTLRQKCQLFTEMANV